MPLNCTSMAADLIMPCLILYMLCRPQAQRPSLGAVGSPAGGCVQAAKHDAEVARDIRARFEQLVQRSPMPRAIESRLGRAPVFNALQQTPATAAARQRSAVPSRHLMDATQHIFWTQGEPQPAEAPYASCYACGLTSTACDLLQQECTFECCRAARHASQWQAGTRSCCSSARA